MLEDTVHRLNESASGPPPLKKPTMSSTPAREKPVFPSTQQLEDMTETGAHSDMSPTPLQVTASCATDVLDDDDDDDGEYLATGSISLEVLQQILLFECLN